MSLLIVTGQSGTGIRSAVKDYGSAYDRPYHSLEHDFIVPWVRQHKSTFSNIRPSQRVTIREVLKQPEILLRPIWRQGFGTFVEQLEDEADQNELLLTLHACWWHLTSEAFVSPIDFGAISALRDRVDRVVCLIDDAYDVLRRLQRPYQLFGYPATTRSEVVDRLMHILRWREMEVRYSGHLAQVLGAEHILLSVKHAKRTFRAVENGAPVAYLSHPITAARGAGLGNGWGKDFMEYVNGVALALSKSDDLALVLPTTIDEYRFSVDGNSRVEAHLTRRWESRLSQDRESDPLWQPPDDHEGQEIDPFAGFDREPGADVDGLVSEIVRQIKWRDRELVEQASHLVVVRPYAGDPDLAREPTARRDLGRCSGGVFTEIDLQNQLRAIGDRLSANRPAIGSNVLLQTPHEERARRATALTAVRRHLAATGHLLNWSNETEIALWQLLLSDGAELLSQISELSSSELGQQLEEKWFARFAPSPRFTLPEFRSTMSSSDTDFAERARAQDRGGEAVKAALEADRIDDTILNWQWYSIGVFDRRHTHVVIDRDDDGQRAGLEVAQALLA